MTLFTPAYRSLFAISLLLAACQGGPEQRNIPLQSEMDMEVMHGNIRTDVHRVVVEEIRQGDSYLYLLVREGDQQYWIATAKREVEKGEVYVYNEALRRTQFESKALATVFDTIYLVTRIVPEAEAGDMTASQLQPPRKMENETVAGQETPTAITLAALLENPGAYQDQWVELEAKCVKVNEGIMNRNWLHLTDGTDSGRELVATSRQLVAVGSQVRLKGVVRLDRDFGSGYRYAILLEQAEALP